MFPKATGAPLKKKPRYADDTADKNSDDDLIRTPDKDHPPTPVNTNTAPSGCFYWKGGNWSSGYQVWHKKGMMGTILDPGTVKGQDKSNWTADPLTTLQNDSCVTFNATWFRRGDRFIAEDITPAWLGAETIHD